MKCICILTDGFSEELEAVGTLALFKKSRYSN